MEMLCKVCKDRFHELTEENKFTIRVWGRCSRKRCRESLYPLRESRSPQASTHCAPGLLEEYRYSIPPLEGDPVYLTSQDPLVLLCEYRDNRASYSLEVALATVF